MSGPYSECQVRLHRDALNTPWGIRLQGGKDFKTPLTVQRVFVGSPADGDLHRGDVIVAIDNYDTGNLTHKQAQDIIKNAGGSLSFRLKRGGGISGAASKPIVFTPPAPGPTPAQYRSRPSNAPSSPKTPNVPGMSYGVDYSRGQYNQSYSRPPGPDHMLNKVQSTLNHQLWSADDSQDPEYEKKPLGQIKQMFSNTGMSQSQPVHSQPRSSYQPRHQPWRKPTGDGGALADPGWAPKAKDGWSAVPTPEAPYREIVNRAQQAPAGPVYGTEQQRHRDMGKPAWSGSLRPGGGTRPWEVQAGDTIVPGGVEAHVPRGPSDVPRQAPPSQSYKPQQQPQQQQQQPQQQAQHSPNIHGQVHNPRVQNVHYAPGQSPQYQQRAPQESDTAAVVHQQYNSPLGLYSRENVKAVLHGQTSGKPGQGTMQVTGGDGKKQFNPAQSDVYRLLQEEEEVKHRSQQSARYQDQTPGQEMHYQGFMDHTHQSPKMNALEQYVMDEGTSDF